MSDILLKEIKENAGHLRVQGAYVQQPIPGMVAIKEDEIIMSNDAAALYPTSEILSNIGYETLKGRIYDPGIVDNMINLLENVEKHSDKGAQVINQAYPAFTSAVQGMIKNYTKRKSVKNKKDFLKVNSALLSTYFLNICDFLINKKENTLENIYHPKTDKEYFLLKSNLFPMLETISWLSEKNKGYSDIIVNYVFHHDKFDSIYKSKKFYYFSDINSCKTHFNVFGINEIKNEFEKYFLNPYGTLFMKHEDQLAYTASENMKGLSRRRIIKNAMLCISGILKKYNSLSEDDLEIFLSVKDKLFKIDEKNLEKLFMKIDETTADNVQWRVSSLKDFEFEKNFEDSESLLKYLSIRTAQLNSSQNGIKVTLNSGYGITGMTNFSYSSILIANSITTAGKIYGIKLFQKISYDTIENEYEEREKNG